MKDTHAAMFQTKGIGNLTELPSVLEAAEGAALNFGRSARSVQGSTDIASKYKNNGRERLGNKIKESTKPILSSRQIATVEEQTKIAKDGKVGTTLYYLSYLFGDMLFRLMEEKYDRQKAQKMFFIFL